MNLKSILFGKEKGSQHSSGMNKKIKAKYLKIIESIIPDNQELLFAGSRSFEKVGSTHPDGRVVSVNEVVEVIKRCMAVILEKQGFKFLKSRKLFKRKTNNGVEEISLVFYDYVHYEIQFHIGKRIDEVQKIITKFEYEHGYNSNPNYKDFSTVTGFYPEFDRMCISSYNNLKDQMTNWLYYLEVIVIPSLDQVDSVESLNEIFNYPDKHALNPLNYYAKQDWNDCPTRGMVFALMSHDHEKYKVLKEKQLKNKNDIKKRTDLITFLDKLFPHEL